MDFFLTSTTPPLLSVVSAVRCPCGSEHPSVSWKGEVPGSWWGIIVPSYLMPKTGPFFTDVLGTSVYLVSLSY